MNEEKDRFFTVMDKSGKEIEYEILFTFDSDETEKSYIVFTDGTTDADGNTNTFAATYEKTGKELKLTNIETESEWNLIENLLSNLEDKMNE